MATIKHLDHVNIRTANVPGLIDWYGRVLGLKTGPRPDFPFPGAWLYAGDHAIIHLVGRDEKPTDPQEDLHFEHFAVAGTGLGTMLDALRASGERYAIGRPPGFPIVQVNLWDPDGNHLHVDFAADEADGLDLS